MKSDANGNEEGLSLRGTVDADSSSTRRQFRHRHRARSATPRPKTTEELFVVDETEQTYADSREEERGQPQHRPNGTGVLIKVG